MHRRGKLDSVFGESANTVRLLEQPRFFFGLFLVQVSLFAADEVLIRL